MSNFKRAAGRELNHDNWNEEEEDEEVGEFKRASEDVLKRRSIKVAKRRMQDSEDGKPKMNPFSGFGGFSVTNNAFSTSTPAVSTSSSTPFAFLGKLGSTTTASSLTTAGSSAAITSTAVPKTNGTSASVTFHKKLEELNKTFLEWIKKNLDTDSVVDLTPCFKSYEENLKSLKDSKQTAASNVVEQKSKEDEKKAPAASTFSFGVPANKKETPAVSTSTASPSGSSVFTSFQFGSSPTSGSTTKSKEDEAPSKPQTGFAFSSGFGSTSKPAEDAKITSVPSTTGSAAASTFSFGLPKATSPDTSKNLTSSNTPSFSFGFSKPDAAVSSQPSATPSFSFGLKATSTAVFGGLSSAAPSFSFGNVTQVSKADETATTTAEEETEEPPKNEFVPVVENDSLFSKRCKVFVKSGEDYADRGIGTLYIKKVDDKIQMIVRADTNLGNILLNIMLTNGLPASRLGKNNVMLVCIPTPDAKPPPTSVLLRVKNGEEADEVLEMINKHKMSE